VAVELWSGLRYGTAVSVTVDYEVVGPGSDDHLEAAWALKERIRERDGVLRQRHGFFSNAYRRSTVHVYRTEDELVGFASVRRDGYILFLAVAPEYRGEGFGERLVAAAAEDHDVLTCHARTTNENAVSFYQHLGFTIERRIERYYEDGGDAYYLKLGDGDGITARISRLFGR
jgi:ribosomal-protein-alanine N-acetyltransferase